MRLFLAQWSVRLQTVTLLWRKINTIKLRIRSLHNTNKDATVKSERYPRGKAAGPVRSIRGLYAMKWSTCLPREYELLPEAHIYFSVVLNCSKFSLCVYCLLPPPCSCLNPPTPPLVVCPGGRETAGRRGGVQHQQGMGAADIHREQNW